MAAAVAVVPSALLAASGVSHPRGSVAGRTSLRTVVTPRASDGPVRKPAPVAPAAPPKPMAPTPPSPVAPEPAVPAAAESKPAAVSTSTISPSSTVTVEYQRQRAKELIAYFEDKKYEEQAAAGRVFGFSRKNEINNGRWTMFGLAVGLLTELATGVNFPDQLKIIAANLGIADFDF